MPLQSKHFINTLLLGLAAGAACSALNGASGTTRTFRFSSGGAHHPEGFGEWSVELNSAGGFSALHNVRGDITDFGAYALPDATTARLWELIDDAEVDRLRSSERAGLPDELRYTFEIQTGGETHTAAIWVGEAREVDAIVALVTEIGDVIEMYTGLSPVLR